MEVEGAQENHPLEWDQEDRVQGDTLLGGKCGIGSATSESDAPVDNICYIPRHGDHDPM